MEGEGRNGLIQGQQEKKKQIQKCPRCDSLDTKFCYFNNYSQSQPRYFCKACRRFWTQGGNLRNVPIGGGSHKGKRARVASSSGEAVRSLPETPTAPALQQSNSTSSPPNIVPSNSVLGDSESGSMVPAFALSPPMIDYYPGPAVDDGAYLSLLSNNKSLSTGGDAAGTSNFSVMSDFNVQPFSYQQPRQIQPQQFCQMGNKERKISLYQRQPGLTESAMPAGGSAYQPYWSQNFMNNANDIDSIFDTSIGNSVKAPINDNPNGSRAVGASLVPNHWPWMPEYDPSP